MATSVYIDGFNLYYGALKGRPGKWLDLQALCRALLPRDEITRIRYFTARAAARPHDLQVPVRQDAYLRALATLPLVTIHEGRFLTTTVRMALAQPRPGWPATVEVIKTEEKGSDVNLASYLLLDGFRQAYDTAVVISNDSDLAEPIRMVSTELGRHVGIYSPRERLSVTLREAGQAFHRRINPSAVTHSQLPDPVIDAAGRRIAKPASW